MKAYKITWKRINWTKAYSFERDGVGAEGTIYSINKEEGFKNIPEDAYTPYTQVEEIEILDELNEYIPFSWLQKYYLEAPVQDKPALFEMLELLETL